MSSRKRKRCRNRIRATPDWDFIVPIQGHKPTNTTSGPTIIIKYTQNQKKMSTPHYIIIFPVLYRSKTTIIQPVEITLVS